MNVQRPIINLILVKWMIWLRLPGVLHHVVVVKKGQILKNRSFGNPGTTIIPWLYWIQDFMVIVSPVANLTCLVQF
jgi:hypothetical protein